MLFLFVVLLSVDQAQARIRLRKVKDPPRTCTVMKQDDLLSRPIKPIWSTERHSVVISDDVTLLNDLGVKVCSWNKNLFGKNADLSKFRFYVDEYKEYIYPYIETKDNGTTLYKVAFKDCSMANKVTLGKLELPVCEKPRKISKKQKQKSKSTAALSSTTGKARK